MYLTNLNVIRLIPLFPFYANIYIIRMTQSRRVRTRSKYDALCPYMALVRFGFADFAVYVSRNQVLDEVRASATHTRISNKDDIFRYLQFTVNKDIYM